MKTRHFAQLVVLSALWGATFFLIRVASPVLGPQVMATLRVALATLALTVLMRVLRHRWPLAHWRELLGLAAFTVALPFLLFAWAGLHLPAGYSALLNTSAVVFGTLSAAWFRQDTLTARKLLGCLCGFAGVALIVRLGPIALTPTTLLAAGACVLAAASYGITTPLMKRTTARLEPLAIAGAIHLAALLMLLPAGLYTLPQARYTGAALGAVAVMGVVTSGLAYWAHLRIIRRVSPVAAMTPVFLMPVFGVTWGHLFLDEPLSPGIFAGGALVLLACALVTGFNPLRRAAVPETMP